MMWIRTAAVLVLALVGVGAGLNADCKVPSQNGELRYDHCETIAGGLDLYYSFTATSIDVTYSYDSSGWVSFGFVPSPQMVGNAVVIAYGMDDDPSTNFIGDYSLDGKSSSRVIQKNRQNLDADELSVVVEGGELYARFVRARDISGEVSVNPGTAIVIWAYGGIVPDRPDAITYHVDRYSLVITLEDSPNPEPTKAPPPKKTEAPKPEPTEAPSPKPTEAPSPKPTKAPPPKPTKAPPPKPTTTPPQQTTKAPKPKVTAAPSPSPQITDGPSKEATPRPSAPPSTPPTSTPSSTPPSTPMPTMTPTPPAAASTAPAESSSPSPSPEGVCFPGTALVTLCDGSFKPMRQLQVGDVVRTSELECSDVFAFGHRLDEEVSAFVQLEIDGDLGLELSRSHYIPVENGLLKAAGMVQLGDRVTLQNGSQAAVVAISEVRRVGLYNPHTLDGQIVVNQIVASTFTQAVHPTLARVLLAVPRAIYQLKLSKEPLGTLLYRTLPAFVRRDCLRGPPKLWVSI